ncbi:Fanconi anemia group C protein [Larimichthys crocea]|uniref:Uncharacterized protein n=1 Tax=Larimichthys crocea TaxID=215358 RepID=A0ACD3QAC8_LARCR|nr:Fanconi anemia group C protein [Larimichthys crocea]
MSQLQIQLQQTAEPLLNVQEMQFWLDKAVAWGQADSPDTRKDTCLHLSRLRDFLQQLLTHINNMNSTTETMKTLPFLGQFLGRLCWNPYVTAEATSRRLLFQCLWELYTEHPGNAVERKANQWIRKVLCQLATEDDDAAAQTLMKHTGVPPEEYHLKVLRKPKACAQHCSIFLVVNDIFRGHHKVFDAWFLLVQCAHWVQAAVQLLVTSGPEDCGPLMWLLTFYHHPTNRWHHRALQLVHAKEAWDHLRSLFSVVARPLPVDRLQSLVTLLSSQPQRPSASPLLILNLLVNFAVFFQQSLSGSTEILQTVVERSGLVDEAACVLSSLELRLNEGSCLSRDANRVHLRIKALQNTITHMCAASSPAEN